jgi:predicted RNA-binding protein YlxR (DUF448 family)
LRRGHTPIRTCVGCRKRKPKSGMVRLTIDGVDLHGLREGRGFYLCRDISCVKKGLMRPDVKRRLGDTGCSEALRVLSAMVEKENCLDGSRLGSVICDQYQGGRPIG